MNSKPMAMRDALLETIWQSMSTNANLIFLSADFGSPILDKIRRDFPNRFINVGIAEQNLINIAAGLALEGFTVFAYAIAPFITMRCYEQIRVNLALLSNLRSMNVNLIGVGAGYSYALSGPTHQCYEDISIMRTLPTMQLLSPADHVSCASLFERCIQQKGPKYLRLDAQVLPIIYESAPLNIMDGFHVHKKGAGICLVATGYMLHTALKVANALEQEGILLGVIDLFDLCQFSKPKLRSQLQHYSMIVSLEEGFRGKGGLDALLSSWISEEAMRLQFKSIGVINEYHFEIGSREQLHEQVGIGKNVILEKLYHWIKHEISVNA